MPNLLLTFEIPLEERRPGKPLEGGPQFHRWLPDGEKDALVVETGSQDTTLKVWFERRGFVDGGVIAFDNDRREVHPDVVARQARLGAGPLVGSLEVRGLPPQLVEPIANGQTGDPHYKTLGATVVGKLLVPAVTRFLRVIRINYGQWWLKVPRRWDGRPESLGTYCSEVLNLRHSLDEGETWSEFLPTKPKRELPPITEEFTEYLTKNDWQSLGTLAGVSYDPSPAAEILARANELGRQGELRYAIIEATCALELACGEFVRGVAETAEELAEAIQLQSSQPLHKRVRELAERYLEGAAESLKLCLEGIETRNRMVHQGAGLPEHAAEQVEGLIEIAGALIPGPGFKRPYEPCSNTVLPESQWEELARLTGGDRIRWTIQFGKGEPVEPRSFEDAFRLKWAEMRWKVELAVLTGRIWRVATEQGAGHALEGLLECEGDLLVWFREPEHALGSRIAEHSEALSLASAPGASQNRILLSPTMNEPQEPPPTSQVEICRRLVCAGDEEWMGGYAFAVDLWIAMSPEGEGEALPLSLFVTDPLTDSVPGRLIELAHLREPFFVVAHRDCHEYETAEELRLALKDVRGWPLDRE